MLASHGSGLVGAANPPCAVCLERSYDNTGTVTGTYYNLTIIQQNTIGLWQAIFSTGGTTTLETAGLPLVLPKAATTGNVGSTTHVSPVFPLVGGIGNPLTGLMVYRASSGSTGDYADNQFVYVTIYGVQHAFITWAHFVANSTTQANSFAGIMVRYD
jgi:hypothetical protein